jgi:hypothetical protein
MEFQSYTPGQAIEGTEPLEDGRHECVIVSAEDKFDNDGTANLRVVFQPIKGAEVYAWPVLKISDTARGIRFGAALADALQIDRSNGLDLDPRELRGKRVLVSTRRWVDDQSRTNVGVDSIRGTWTVRGGAVAAAPAPAAESAPVKAKPRTPAAAVAAARGDEAGGSDDVPFLWMLPFLLAAAAAGGMA